MKIDKNYINTPEEQKDDFVDNYLKPFQEHDYKREALEASLASTWAVWDIAQIALSEHDITMTIEEAEQFLKYELDEIDKRVSGMITELFRSAISERILEIMEAK